jgi:hypothetical protein
MASDYIRIEAQMGLKTLRVDFLFRKVWSLMPNVQSLSCRETGRESHIEVFSKT